MTTPKIRAIAIAGRARMGFAILERALQDAAVLAADEDGPAEVDKIANTVAVLQSRVGEAHELANSLGNYVAAYFGDEANAALYSGGTEPKPGDEPPPPPPPPPGE